MLDQELRKLRDMDMTIVRNRQKRLDTKRKQTIIKTKQDAEDAINTTRALENLVTEKSIGNLFKMS